METVVLSPNYQIIIPDKMRKQIGAEPGQQFWVQLDAGSIRFIPKKNIEELFGSLKGINTDMPREDEDRI